MEKLRIKSKNRSCLLPILILGGEIVIITIIFAIISWVGYHDAVESYIKYDWDFSYCSSAHEYAMQDRVYYYMAIACGINAILGSFLLIICLWRKISTLTITDRRIIGRTIYGDKFQYPLEQVQNIEIVEGKNLHITITSLDFPLQFRGFENTNELLSAINNPSYCSSEAKIISTKRSEWYDGYKNNHRKQAIIPPAICILVVAAIVIGTFQGCSAVLQGSSTATCKSCGRTFNAGDTGKNFMNIGKTGMCGNCEDNYHWGENFMD